VPCRRHPRAASHCGYCAVCLLEEALAPEVGGRQLTIQVPLGETPSASVFLVKDGGPAHRLLRLKTWRRPAAAGFLERFHRLQARLESWTVEGIIRPIAAGVDALGRPSVLTEFKQGVPILDRVRSGRLDREEAIARLTPLITLIESAHTRGLFHGSIAPGNVIVGSDSPRVRLLDFGLAPLMSSAEDYAALSSADIAGFAALTRTLRL
jgi:serine/threonine protein kinase